MAESRTFASMRSPRVLAVALGVPPRSLEGIALDPSQQHMVPLHVTSGTPGKSRRIDRPKDLLKRIQRRIHDLLVAEVKLSPDLHGGVPGGSYDSRTK
jgi:hypothetical protein